MRQPSTQMLLLAVFMMILPTVARGQDAAAAPNEQPIATVLGKPVYEKDLQIAADDQSPLRDYRAIAGRVMPPLVDRYIAAHGLTATPGEIKEFRTVLLKTQVPLGANLSPEQREARERAHARAQVEGSPESKVLDQMATKFVERWKFNKALYEKYGGRVIGQQMGPEPLDAYRDWLADEQKAGRYEIHDPKWEAALAEYQDPKYHVFVDAPEPFASPFWKQPGKPPAAKSPAP